MRKLRKYNIAGDVAKTYTVKSGDTFFGIANKLGVSWSDLKTANPNINYDKLSLGQVLNVPKQKSAKKDTEKTVAEKVVKQETDADSENIYNEYFTNLKFQENSVNEGLKDGLYYPYTAVEDKGKKNPTFDIGFGNKLTAAEKIKYSKGITKEKAEEMMKTAFKQKQKYAANYIDQEYGKGTFEKLDPASKVILTDYQYNVAGGIGEFPNFAKGVVDKDKDVMLKEYIRHSGGKPIGQRNTFTKDWINKYYEDKPKEQDGGYVDIELTDEEVEKYKQGGYVVEELPKANLGKIIKQAVKGSGKKVVSTTAKGTKSYIKNLNVKATPSFKKPLKLNKVSAPKSIPKSFKSEIDWGSWNKAIPNNKKLLQEYREIEYTTKLNGSWLKNVDGSPFQGMPEQFVQQQSKNFKKAFPDVYKQNDVVTPLIHHSGAKFSSFDKAKQLSGTGVAKHGSGIYTIPKPYFDRYVTKDIKQLMNPTSSKQVTIGYGNNRYDLYANNPLDEFPIKGRYIERPRGIFPEPTPRGSKYRTYNTNYKTDPFAAVVPYSSGVKSAVGNDGMFNMANSDIYKSLLPFIMGTGAASQLYNKGGELRSYEPGGTQDEPTDEVDNPLQMWNLMQKDRWSGINENTSKGKSILSEYNKRMGVNYNPSDAWSAITISNAVMANTGAKDKNQIRALGFNPTKSHSGYVSDAFATNTDPDYKYNRYKAEKPGGNYSVGDIVVKGRRNGKDVGTSKWSYEDFATHGKGYVSHGDIVVDKGIDDDGEYVILAGGNLGDTYKNKKVYTKNLGSQYKVKLTDTKGGVKLTDSQGSSNEQELYKDPFLSDFNWEPYGGRQATTSVKPEEEYFQGYLNAGSNPNAYTPPTLDTLGIGYTPYSYKFPTSLLDSEEDVVDYVEDDISIEGLQSQIDASKNIEAPIDGVDAEEYYEEGEEKEEEKEKDFKPKSYTAETSYRTKYSDEDKSLVESIEEELANLRNTELKEIQSIGSSEMEAATTDEEKAAAKLKQFQSLMSMSGMTTVGDNKDAVEVVTNKYKEKRKALEEKLTAAKLSLDAKLLEENKITENQFLKSNAPGYVEAGKDFDKNIKSGYIWNSWAVEDQELLGSMGAISNSNLIDGQYAWKGKENRDSVEDLFQQEWLNNKEFGRIYGDGSLKYGQWISNNEYDTKMQEIANQEYQRQQMDPTGMGQSGRAVPWYPELNLVPGGWGAKIATLAFELGLSDNPNANFLDSYWLTSLIGDLPEYGQALGAPVVDFAGGAAENVSDFFSTTFGKKKPGEKGYGEYQNATQRQRDADDAYRQRRQIMQSISGTNSIPIAGGRSLKSGGSVSSIWKERTGTNR